MNEKAVKTGKWRRFGGWAGVWLVGLLGCAGTRDQRDPLMGGTPIETPPPASPTKTAGLPPLPNQTGNTNATLAGLNGGRPPLLIGENTVVFPGGTVAQASNPPPGGTPTGPKVSPLPKTMTASSQVEESLNAQLRSAGVYSQKVDPAGEGLIRLTVMTPGRNANDGIIYEATAGDYPSAVMAVLQKIQANRQ